MRAAVAVAAVLVSGAALASPWSAVQGNGKIVSQTREVASFHAVGIPRGIQAEIRTGAEPSVKITGDENLLAIIRTRVENGRLVIETDDDQGLRPTRPIRMEISTRRIDAVGASGGSKVHVDRMEGDDLDVAASGGSEVRVDNLSGDRLDVAASGGSEVRLNGRAKTVELAMSGGSEIHASTVAANEVEVAGSGGSQAELQASGSLRGALSGGSNVTVSGPGPARREVISSGGSRVTYREG